MADVSVRSTAGPQGQSANDADACAITLNERDVPSGVQPKTRGDLLEELAAAAGRYLDPDISDEELQSASDSLLAASRRVQRPIEATEIVTPTVTDEQLAQVDAALARLVRPGAGELH
jgi:hypothetical protein